MAEVLALDKSMRRKDEDGRLHVADCRLSKATVNPYRGREIPRAAALGLDPDRIYQLWRHPDELAKAAPTWSGIPLMSAHVPHSAAEPVERAVAGAIGTNARWEAPYVVADLTIWRQEDIDDVESRDKCELSAGYYYEADMAAGVTPEGQAYDGIMRNIRANHEALVTAGRAGPDVMVHDSLEGLRMPLPSRTAIAVRGALVAHLRPKLATGTSLMALDTALADTFADTWDRERAKVATVIKARFGKALAADASLDDLPTFLGALDAEEDGEEDDLEGEDEEMTEAERKEEREARAEDRKKGMDAAARKGARDSRRGARDAKRAADKKAMDAKAAKDKAAKDKKAKDKAARDRWKAADTEKSFEDWAREEEEEPEHADDETEAERVAKEAEDKKAMDSAIETAVTAAEKRVVDRMKALAVARDDVRPIIGNVSMAVDTAAAVYKMALDHLGVDTKDVPPAAYAAVLKAIPKAPARQPSMAHDQQQSTELYQMFPHLARIRHA